MNTVSRKALCGLRSCLHSSFRIFLHFTPLSILGESCDINTWPGLHHDILPPRWLPTDSCLASLCVCVRMSVCTPAGHDVTRRFPPPQYSFTPAVPSVAFRKIPSLRLCRTSTKQIPVVLLHDAVAHPPSPPADSTLTCSLLSQT